MKLTFEGLYGEINTMARGSGYLTGGDDIFSTGYSSGIGIYYPFALNQYDVYRNMEGITFDHVLSPNTFYNIRISHVRVKNLVPYPGPDEYRDANPVRYFGTAPVDESPYGFSEQRLSMTDGLLYGALCEARDWSEVNTLNVKFDLTSQFDRYNQIKVGLMYNYDDDKTHWEHVRTDCPVANTRTKYRQFPYRVGAYVQDKLEFEGMIANFGVRLDYNDPNCEWYTLDRYSEYFQYKYRDNFTEVTPTEPAKGHIKISPRLGVSHPISDNAKLYFNYGHFYSMPRSSDMYRIYYGSYGDGISAIGNPSANLPLTTAYELGVEYNVSNLFLVHLSGYYKDVRDQTGSIQYTNYDGSVDYTTYENNNYADIRGFELRLDKRFGQWITGWLNYNYMVTTSGYIGRQHYYQDEREQAIYGLQNPYQERPLARPVLRANLNFRTPRDWGPAMAGIKPLGDIHLATLYTWKAGKYVTWDPLETYELQDNLQWKGSYNFDARFSKRMRFGKYSMQIFADIKNLFNTKYINERGFRNDTDRTNYYESLHLPMYEGEIYQAEGYIGGNDKPGDIKSDDKSYLNMPDREFLTYFNPRCIFFGLKVDF